MTYDSSSICAGKSVAGATLLTRNEFGLINNIKLFQSPFPVVREFASGLKERFAGTEVPYVFRLPTGRPHAAISC